MFKKVLCFFSAFAVLFIFCLPVFALDNLTLEDELSFPDLEEVGKPMLSEDLITQPLPGNLPAPVENKKPLFSAEIIKDKNSWTLYGTLPSLNGEMSMVTPYYSFDGINFTENLYDDYGDETSDHPMVWNISDNAGDKTQVCFYDKQKPFLSFLSGKEKEFWICLKIESEEYSGFTEAVKLHTDDQALLPFNASMKELVSGYMVMGTLPVDAEAVEKIEPYSSEDGDIYTLSSVDEWDLDILDDEELYIMTHPCLAPRDDTLMKFLSGDIDSFFIRLKVTYNSENSVYERLTEAVQIVRNPDIADIPKDIKLSAWFGEKLADISADSAKYHVTVREGTDIAELEAALMQEIPVNVHFNRNTPYMYTVKPVAYNVNWNLAEKLSPSVLAAPQNGAVITYQPHEIIPPNEAVLALIDGNYRYTPPTVSQSLELVITTVPKAFQPVPLLSSNSGNNLSFSLQQKPTAAQSITAEYSLNGGKTWQVVGGSTPKDSIAEGYAVDDIPKYSVYTGYDFFDAKQSPLKEYREGKIGGFLIRLQIKGGVFDGVSQTAAWPSDYNYTPPPLVGNGDGSGGNRGDVGSENGDTNGERPNLPNDESAEKADSGGTVNDSEKDIASDSQKDNVIKPNGNKEPEAPSTENPNPPPSPDEIDTAPDRDPSENISDIPVGGNQEWEEIPVQAESYTEIAPPIRERLKKQSNAKILSIAAVAIGAVVATGAAIAAAVAAGTASAFSIIAKTASVFLKRLISLFIH